MSIYEVVRRGGHDHEVPHADASTLLDKQPSDMLGAGAPPRSGEAAFEQPTEHMLAL